MALNWTTRVLNNNNNDNENNRSMFISIQFCSNYRTETNALLTETVCVFRCQCNVNKFQCICWLHFMMESETEEFEPMPKGRILVHIVEINDKEKHLFEFQMIFIRLRF